MNLNITSGRRLVMLCFAVLVGITANAPTRAATCATADEAGVMQTTNEEPSNCADYVLLSQSDYDALRNPFGLDPDFSVVYWSAGATLLMWSLGLGAGAIFNIIRKAR
jgi:hypothetical protein